MPREVAEARAEVSVYNLLQSMHVAVSRPFYFKLQHWSSGKTNLLGHISYRMFVIVHTGPHPQHLPPAPTPCGCIIVAHMLLRILFALHLMCVCGGGGGGGRNVYYS